jgi:hypothetical protein
VAQGGVTCCSAAPAWAAVVNVGVTLTEGSFHAVDSSDMAFHSATRAGIAEALVKAGPLLLEPTVGLGTFAHPFDHLAEAAPVSRADSPRSRGTLKSRDPLHIPSPRKNRGAVTFDKKRNTIFV